MVAFLVSAAITGLVISIFYLGGIYGAMFPKKFLGDDPEESIEEIIKKNKMKHVFILATQGLLLLNAAFILYFTAVYFASKRREKRRKLSNLFVDKDGNIYEDISPVRSRNRPMTNTK
jgi:hypothetical protein